MKRCVDEPSPEMPMRDPRTREVVADRCPWLCIDRDAADLLDLLNLSDEGAWPVDGGTLAQADGFMEARKFVRMTHAELLKEKAEQDGRTKANP